MWATNESETQWPMINVNLSNPGDNWYSTPPGVDEGHYLWMTTATFEWDSS
jgi:hypothetical protein